MPASEVLSAADIAEFRALVEDLAYPDVCEIRRQVDAGTDEFGNPLPPTTATFESGPCSLRSGGLQPNERLAATRLEYATPYAIDLPFPTIVTVEDTIRVNGTRTFEVGGVIREGEWGIDATAVCVERG